MNRRDIIALGTIACITTPRWSYSQIITPPESLKLEGFFALPTIRTGYAPGTILEKYVQSGIQKTRIFFELKDLDLNPPINILLSEEEIPASDYSTSLSIAGALEFILASVGLRPKVAASFSSGSTLAIKYGRGYRESIKGPDAIRIIKAALEKGLPLPGQYSLITSTISFRKIEARLSSKMGMDLETDLAAAAGKANGNIKIVTGQSGVLIPGEFSTPMRAFYSWDEIRPASGSAVGSNDVTFDRIRGRIALPIDSDLH
nr:hypothetical protein [uncultured Albidiferax sp.]